MAKKLSESPSDSSLSPPPENLADEAPTVTVESTVSRKRKAESPTTTTATKRTKEVTAAKFKTPGDVSAVDVSPQPKRRAAKKKVTVEETVGDEAKVHGNANDETKAKKKTTRKKKEGVLVPLAERTIHTKLLVGAHVSSAGGVHNALTNLVSIGGNAFALFLKNQRKWENPELDPEFAKLFIEGCRNHGIDAGKCCLPHGSYLVNLAHPDPERKKQAYDSFVNDLARCHTLGINLYNFHPGNANATTREEGIRLIAQNINEAHRDPATGEVVAVLETMASLGNTIGGTFADLAEIIALVDNKNRIGVCLDTCHVFAAGYDLRTPDAYKDTMQTFEKVIGLKYLKALHINDSKAPLSSHRDLHARIGTGYLGLRAFHNIVNDKRLHGLPMVLETPVDVIGEDGKKFEDKGIWAREIKMLESLVGMDVESNEFKELGAKLHEEGEGERERIGNQVERKRVQDAKPKKTTKKTPHGGSENEVKPEKKTPTKKPTNRKATTEDEDDPKPRKSRGKTKIASYADDVFDE